MKQYLQLIWLRGTGSLKADAQSSYLGSVWWVLEPLLLSLLFYLAFAQGLRQPGNDVFVFFLLTGMLPFKWTASSISISARSILTNSGIIGQVYIPKWIFPSSVNLSMLIRFIFVILLLVGIVTFAGYEPSKYWLALFYVVVCQLIFNLGISFLAASIVPVLPDVDHLIPILVTALLFTSGIFYDISERPEEIQAILNLNPFVQILNAYRSILLHGNPLHFSDLSYAFYFGVICLVLGYFSLSRFDRYYPRVIQ
jgi:lipopolysaccharide transport system permease protein